MRKILSALRDNSFLYYRIVIFIVFIGHAFVNFGWSSSIELHIKIIQSLRFLNAFDPHDVARNVGYWDILFAIWVLVKPNRFLLMFGMAYTLFIGCAAWVLYLDVKNSPFGIAEIMRRLCWFFNILFLYFILKKGEYKYDLLRIGIAFAFIAHGTASLGILGMNGAHIELAGKIIPKDNVNDFVFYSGISDFILGLMLLSGLLSRYAAWIGVAWLLFVVWLSFLTGIPEGIFRTGFLLSIVYVAIDARCHSKNVFSLFKAKPKTEV